MAQLHTLNGHYLTLESHTDARARMSQLLTSEGAVNSRGPQLDVTPFVAHASPLGASGRLRIGVRSKSSGELRYFDGWRHGHGGAVHGSHVRMLQHRHCAASSRCLILEEDADWHSGRLRAALAAIFAERGDDWDLLVLGTAAVPLDSHGASRVVPFDVRPHSFRVNVQRSQFQTPPAQGHVHVPECVLAASGRGRRPDVTHTLRETRGSSLPCSSGARADPGAPASSTSQGRRRRVSKKGRHGGHACGPTISEPRWLTLPFSDCAQDHGLRIVLPRENLVWQRDAAKQSARRFEWQLLACAGAGTHALAHPSETVEQACARSDCALSGKCISPSASAAPARKEPEPARSSPLRAPTSSPAKLEHLLAALERNISSLAFRLGGKSANAKGAAGGQKRGSANRPQRPPRPRRSSDGGSVRDPAPAAKRPKERPPVERRPLVLSPRQRTIVYVVYGGLVTMGACGVALCAAALCCAVCRAGSAKRR